MDEVRRRGAASIEPTHEATEAFDRLLREAMKGTVWVTGCNSGYLDAEGTPILWPWTARRLHREMRRPDFSEFELRSGDGVGLPDRAPA